MFTLLGFVKDFNHNLVGGLKIYVAGVPIQNTENLAAWEHNGQHVVTEANGRFTIEVNYPQVALYYMDGNTRVYFGEDGTPGGAELHFRNNGRLILQTL